MNENDQLVDTDDITVEQLPRQPFTDSVDASMGSGLFAKVAIGGLVGATFGVIAGALAHKGTAERVNQTVKSVGNAVKGAALSVNQTVKGVGDAVQTVAEGVNDTVKDVGDVVKGTALEVNQTVGITVDSVKGTANRVNQTVKDTVESVKGAAVDVKESGSQDIKTSNKQPTYILVPVEDQQVAESMTPANAGKPAAPSEVPAS